MKEVIRFIRSSVGRKQIVAMTGLMFISFLVLHLTDNMFIFLDRIS